MNIEINDQDQFIDKTYYLLIKKIAKRVLLKLDIPRNSELCITLINDNEMRILSSKYRKINRTTDVLSFPQGNVQDKNILGDVVISFDTAKRHSELYGITLHEEIKKLIVHGVLHLIGYDHKKKKEKDVMRAKEKELLGFVKDL